MTLAVSLITVSFSNDDATQKDDPNTDSKEVAIDDITPSEVTGGEISGVWKKNSTVNVLASFEVPAGKQLIIEEGVKVIIHKNAQDVPVEIMLYGDLICRGTADNMIEFTVPDDQKSSSSATWGGIFGSELGTFGTNVVENPPCIVMQYVKIGYTGALTTANSYSAHTYKSTSGKAVLAINTMAQYSKVIVQNCIFSHTFSDGISQLGGDMIISNNIFEDVGTIVGGEGINVKDREVVDIAYNLFYSPANSCVKLSGASSHLSAGVFAVYNNTCINGGGRRTDSYYGAFGLEQGCKAYVYNNLQVNCKYGVNETSSPAHSESVVGYNWYYGYTQEIVDAFQVDYICPGGRVVIEDVNGTKSNVVGANDPKFVSYPLSTPTTEGNIASGWDFHLQAGSPALTAGADPSVIAPKVNWASTGLTVKIAGDDVTFKSPAPSKYTERNNPAQKQDMNTRSYLFLLFALILRQAAFAGEPLATAVVWPKDQELSFFWISDMGRNGYYQQKPVANRMGDLAEMVMPSFIVTSGDNFHYKGFESVNDPVWLSNFEQIYTHPDLHCPWYPALGSHEHDGNVQAVIDYSKVSRRWEMPAQYYTKVFRLGRDSREEMRLIFIDTDPIVSNERNPERTHRNGQSPERQIRWLDSLLNISTEKWKVVIGHHKIYSNNGAPNSYGDQKEMIRLIDQILRKHHVDFYFSGHCHTFQHIQRPDTETDYVINTSASLARPVNDRGGRRNAVLFTQGRIRGLRGNRRRVPLLAR